MAAADYRLMTEATGQRIAAALEALSGFGAYLTTADVVNNLTSIATDKPLSAAQGKALSDALAMTSISGYSTSGLTYDGCTYVGGGYVKFGKLVIVNMRVNVTSAISSSTTIVSGLPLYGGAYNIVQMANNQGQSVTLNPYGSVLAATLAAGTLIMSAAYMTV